MIFPASSDRCGDYVYDRRGNIVRFIDILLKMSTLIHMTTDRASTESDTTICVSAKFKNKELKGWVEPDIFTGNDENGDMVYQKIHTGEKTSVVFVFEGKYLGGTINENLSFPDELILMQS